MDELFYDLLVLGQFVYGLVVSWAQPERRVFSTSLFRQVENHQFVQSIGLRPEGSGALRLVVDFGLDLAEAGVFDHHLLDLLN